MNLLLSKLKKIETKSSFVKAPLKAIHWVRPVFQCEISFQEMTKRGCFRSPVFLRLI
ncbi:MAG: hypothetical protein DRI86_15560 [Bacteroidetes bacterium]|nr:MAG: hypothetical protein DRI86_15560 [Bacteroidota bacterium]